LASSKPKAKATCLFCFDGLFQWKALKSPNKHPLSRSFQAAPLQADDQSLVIDLEVDEGLDSISNFF
jgi:hypothetical protein